MLFLLPMKKLLFQYAYTGQERVNTSLTVQHQDLRILRRCFMIPVSEKKDIPLSVRGRLIRFLAENLKKEESFLMKLQVLLSLRDVKMPLLRNLKMKEIT